MEASVRRNVNSPSVETGMLILEFTTTYGEHMVSLGTDLSVLSEEDFLSKYGVEKFDVDQRASLVEYLISKFKTAPNNQIVLAKLRTEVEWFSSLIQLRTSLQTKGASQLQ